MNKIEFNTQIATTIEQSKRLFELGLNPNTADMSWVLAPISSEYPHVSLIPYSETKNRITYNIIPAWSLHRLMEMLPFTISLAKGDIRYITILKGSVHYVTFDDDVSREITFNQLGANIYDNMIDCIEWLIKESYFNKEYLK